MSATFVVYIDESGDEGFSFGKGSSEWFVLSAVVTKKAQNAETGRISAAWSIPGIWPEVLAEGSRGITKSKGKFTMDE